MIHRGSVLLLRGSVFTFDRSTMKYMQAFNVGQEARGSKNMNGVENRRPGRKESSRFAQRNFLSLKTLQSETGHAE
jgi:hypothetical protein